MGIDFDGLSFRGSFRKTRGFWGDFWCLMVLQENVINITFQSIQLK